MINNKRLAISAVLLLALTSFAMCAVPTAEASLNENNPTILPTAYVGENYTINLSSYWPANAGSISKMYSDSKTTLLSAFENAYIGGIKVEDYIPMNTYISFNENVVFKGTPKYAGYVDFALSHGQMPANANSPVFFRIPVINITHVITFDVMGGSSVPSKQILAGDSYGTLPTPTKSGYTFAGWYDGATKVSASTKPTKDTTLVANWTANNIQYTAPSQTNKLAVGIHWSQTISTTPNVSISISNASWLSATAGTVSGVPTEAGTYTVTFVLTAPNYLTLTETVTFTIDPQLVLTNNPMSGAIAYVLL